jgi:hypothetical protein
MEGNEVIKHTKKAYNIAKSPKNSWKHKAQEILIEILIIIFAVSISIWLSNWSERRNDKKEQKEFLTGLKEDLRINIENMGRSKQFYDFSLNGMNYFLSTGRAKVINKDSINKYSGLFFSSTDLDPIIGRYEGLKSSGKFKIIENKALLNNIINLHESIIQRIQYLDNHYQQHNVKIETIIFQYMQLSENGEILNPEQIMKRSDFNVLLGMSKGLLVNYMIPIHKEGINKCNEIINQIDKEIK